MDEVGGASYRSATGMRRAQSLNEISSIDNTRRYPWLIVNKVRMKAFLLVLDPLDHRFAHNRMN